MASPRAFYHGTGCTGRDLEELDGDFEVGRVDDNWPADELGNKIAHGNVTMFDLSRLPPGTIKPLPGGPEAWDPVVSERQRRAMYAAAQGKSRLGIPKSVGQEYIRESHGVRNLPERKKKG